jgi:hypothetical protein
LVTLFSCVQKKVTGVWGSAPSPTDIKKPMKKAYNFNVLRIIILIVLLSQDIAGTIPDKPE